MLSVIFRHPVSPRAVSNSFSRSPETPILPNQAKVTPPREHPSGKGQKRIIGDDPRSYAPGGKTLQGKNFQRVFQKAFLMRGRPLKTVHGGDLPPKEIATKEGPFDRNSALGFIDPRSWSVWPGDHRLQLFSPGQGIHCSDRLILPQSGYLRSAGGQLY